MASNVTVKNVNRFGQPLTTDQMIRQFKKKIEKAGVLKDLRAHEFYLKPSVKKKLKSLKAQQQIRKEQAKKQRQLEVRSER